MSVYLLKPNDLLFFRDGRPMEASLPGQGAQWPLPHVFHAALHAALWRAFPSEMNGEHRHANRGNNGDRVERFGSLVTAGPFPIWEGQWYFPTPADLLKSTCLEPDLQPSPPSQSGQASSLPKPLTQALLSRREASKEKPKPWMSKAVFEAYLRGESNPPKDAWGLESKDIYTVEHAVGTAIDSATQSVEEGRLYTSEFMRLLPGVEMGLCAALPSQNGGKDDLQELFREPGKIVVGGQQRTCTVEPCSQAMDQFLPLTQSISGTRVKWVTLSPCVFPKIEPDEERKIKGHPGGWLPNWVDAETGKMLLLDGLGRDKARRKKQKEGASIGAKLVAACVPKPIAVTGWVVTGEKPGAKPLHLATPAGSIYYFEANDQEEARKLINVLSWHGTDSPPTFIRNRRSSLFGEKGFGLGVCGKW
ncbi:MAG: hypothetical protein HY360_12405 [Verrucomicrobia bacterium]|nr:hypothetical protein [Verrucomicrobiota bacterium]